MEVNNTNMVPYESHRGTRPNEDTSQLRDSLEDVRPASNSSAESPDASPADVKSQDSLEAERWYQEELRERVKRSFADLGLEPEGVLRDSLEAPPRDPHRRRNPQPPVKPGNGTSDKDTVRGKPNRAANPKDPAINNPGSFATHHQKDGDIEDYTSAHYPNREIYKDGDTPDEAISHSRYGTEDDIPENYSDRDRDDAEGKTATPEKRNSYSSSKYPKADSQRTNAASHVYHNEENYPKTDIYPKTDNYPKEYSHLNNSALYANEDNYPNEGNYPNEDNYPKEDSRHMNNAAFTNENTPRSANSLLKNHPNGDDYPTKNYPDQGGHQNRENSKKRDFPEEVPGIPGGKYPGNNPEGDTYETANIYSQNNSGSNSDRDKESSLIQKYPRRYGNLGEDDEVKEEYGSSPQYATQSGPTVAETARDSMPDVDARNLRDSLDDGGVEDDGVVDHQQLLPNHPGSIIEPEDSLELAGPAAAFHQERYDTNQDDLYDSLEDEPRRYRPTHPHGESTLLRSVPVGEASPLDDGEAETGSLSQVAETSDSMPSSEGNQASLSTQELALSRGRNPSEYSSTGHGSRVSSRDGYSNRWRNKRKESAGSDRSRQVRSGEQRRRQMKREKSAESIKSGHVGLKEQQSRQTSNASRDPRYSDLRSRARSSPIPADELSAKELLKRTPSKPSEGTAKSKGEHSDSRVIRENGRAVEVAYISDDSGDEGEHFVDERGSPVDPFGKPLGRSRKPDEKPPKLEFRIRVAPSKQQSPTEKSGQVGYQPLDGGRITLAKPFPVDEPMGEREDWEHRAQEGLEDGSLPPSFQDHNNGKDHNDRSSSREVTFRSVGTVMSGRSGGRGSRVRSVSEPQKGVVVAKPAGYPQKRFGNGTLQDRGIQYTPQDGASRESHVSSRPPLRPEAHPLTYNLEVESYQGQEEYDPQEYRYYDPNSDYDHRQQTGSYHPDSYRSQSIEHRLQQEASWNNRHRMMQSSRAYDADGVRRSTNVQAETYHQELGYDGPRPYGYDQDQYSAADYQNQWRSAAVPHPGLISPSNSRAAAFQRPGETAAIRNQEPQRQRPPPKPRPNFIDLNRTNLARGPPRRRYTDLKKKATPPTRINPMKPLPDIFPEGSQYYSDPWAEHPADHPWGQEEWTRRLVQQQEGLPLRRGLSDTHLYVGPDPVSLGYQPQGYQPQGYQPQGNQQVMPSYDDDRHYPVDPNQQPPFVQTYPPQFLRNSNGQPYSYSADHATHLARNYPYGRVQLGGPVEARRLAFVDDPGGSFDSDMNQVASEGTGPGYRRGSQTRTSPYPVLPDITAGQKEKEGANPLRTSDPDGYTARLLKQKQPPQYKQYTLKDYRNLKSDMVLGGLGPDTELVSEKQEKVNRQRDYAKNIMLQNRKQLQLAKKQLQQAKKPREPVPTPDEGPSRRDIAIQYSKKVPKPRMPTPPEVVHERMYGVSPRQHHNEREHTERSASEMARLEELKARHEMEKEKVGRLKADGLS